MEVINIKENEYTPKGCVRITGELKDMLISALRYALGRHTYIVEETCSYIKEHTELLDDRVISVMLRDINDHLEYYKKRDDSDLPSMWVCDKNMIEDLRGFLEDYDVKEKC